MFESKDNREVSRGQKVMVFRNLRNGKWSIKDYKTDLVLGYADEVRLENVEFRVRQGGRRKVLEQKQKNVHAFVIGNFAGHTAEGTEVEEVYYNPYKVSQFTSKEDGSVILRDTQAFLTKGKVFV